jgi:glycine cleavage system H lipoate-binding protein
MFPGVHGFSWSLGNLVFLGIFYSVVIVVLSSVAVAWFRFRRDMVLQRAESIRWHADFEELPKGARTCRHEFSGEFSHRECQLGFDCRGCTVHAGLVAAKDAAAASRETDDAHIMGIPVPLDRAYHRGHTWVRSEGDGTVTIGLDGFMEKVVGTPETVTLPAAGARVEANGTGWRLGRHGSELRILAPVDGTVVDTGSREKGWYLKVRPDGDRLDDRHLLRGREEVEGWLTREVERLQRLLAGESVGMSLADGGEIVNDVCSAYPHADWESVCGDLALEP